VDADVGKEGATRCIEETNLKILRKHYLEPDILHTNYKIHSSPPRDTLNRCSSIPIHPSHALDIQQLFKMCLLVIEHYQHSDCGHKRRKQELVP